MWIWAREEWIWIQVKFADEAQTTVPDSKLYSTNDVKKVATTFFVFCEFTTVFARKSFSRPRPDFTPQTVLIHLKKAPDGMIVPQSEFGIYSTNSSKKSSWWNDCSSTRDRKHPGQVSILYQRQAAWSPNFPQRWRSVPHVPLHLYGRQMRILPIGRKNLNPRPKAAEFFLMSNCLSRIFGTAKWRLAHNSDQEPMLPKSHTPQDNVIVWQICLFISLKIVKTQRLMRSVSNGRNRVKFTQSVRQKQWTRVTAWDR